MMVAGVQGICSLQFIVFHIRGTFSLQVSIEQLVESNRIFSILLVQWMGNLMENLFENAV